MIHYLIDVSWILYRGFYAGLKIWTEYPELHFLCKKLAGLLSRKDCIIHLALDGRNPRGKQLLKENYKAGRAKENVDGRPAYNVYSGLPTFISLLHNDRIKVYFNDNYESDEILFTLSKTLDGRKKILSGDKDILQALDKDTVIESFKGLITTEESYKYEYEDTFFGIEPIKLPIFRAIAGDASDTLKPPVKRFPRKLAAKIVNVLDYDGNCPTVYQLKNVKESLKESEKKWIDRLIESYNDFSTNFNIMKLNVITDSLNNIYMIDKQVDLGEFLKSKIERLNTL